MAEGGQSVFTFDLNESIWFKKGQEVDEMMGISLDPEISIQDMGEFVSIRGVIELKGEYFQVKGLGDSDNSDGFSGEHPSHRLVDQIEAYEDGVNEFFHHFPVEVSIPKYRVNSLDEVMVGIESFDYELPASNQLKLNASLAIHGVTEQRQESTQETETAALQQTELEEEAEGLLEETDPEGAEGTRDNTIPDTPQLEVVKEETELETEEQEVFRFDVKEKAESPAEDHEREQKSADDLPASNDKEQEKVQEKEQEKDRWKQKTQSLAEFFGKVEEVEESAESSHVEYESDDGKAVDVYEESVESSEESPEGRDGETPDTRYLLNIFDNKEERYARLKMCIVQESDTLASLAEKYKVSPLHISKSNRLGDDDIEEGQILYIPVKK
ncbi:stage VI sporulation protein D [Sediminibacillus terrae]|uniref:stage VI sporulation protein D n=1 Tax=Sediminibacillus terrae TaxID=1562106 RepID=UPI0012974F5D|nr:stage VI sporulation protein D [Sediminibacillus terrae]